MPAPPDDRACMQWVMSAKVRDRAMPATLSDGLCAWSFA
jgi:hypothetical protein